MKTLKKGSFLLLTAALGIVTVQAQTADEIVNKYVDALGGKTVLSGIKSLYTENSVEAMGAELTSVTSILYGKGFKNEADFNGTKITQSITEKSGWSVNPMAGQATPTAMTDEQVKTGQAQLQLGGPLYNYSAKGYKVELIGKDTAMGGEYKIKLTGLSGVEATFYINAKTYLLDKEVDKVNAQGQEVELTNTYSDYKKTDAGLVVANARQVKTPQYTINITVQKMEVNKTIDPAIYEMPK